MKKILKRGTKLNKLPRVGVVIVNYINFTDTINCIVNYYSKQIDIDLEIAIVDNASPNDSLIKLKEEFYDNRLIHIIANEVNSGYAAGNNIGIKYLEKCECDYILISNNDIEIENRLLLSQLIDWFPKLENPAFIAPVMLANGVLSREHFAWRLPDKLKEILNSSYFLKLIGYYYVKQFYYDLNFGFDGAKKVDCLPGSFFMGEITLFRNINYFDENTFLYYEETILGYKVKRMALNNYLIQNLKYNHFQECSINTIYAHSEKQKMLLKSKKYFWKRYMHASGLFIGFLNILYYFKLFETFVLKWKRGSK